MRICETGMMSEAREEWGRSKKNKNRILSEKSAEIVSFPKRKIVEKFEFLAEKF